MKHIFTILAVIFCFTFGANANQQVLTITQNCSVSSAYFQWTATNSGDTELNIDLAFSNGNNKRIVIPANGSRDFSTMSSWGSSFTIISEGFTSFQVSASNLSCNIEGVNLTSVCSNDPTKHRWRIYNPNPYPLQMQFQIYPRERQPISVPAAGNGVEKWAGDGEFSYLFFTTDASLGGTVKIYYGNNQEKVKAAGNQTCSISESSLIVTNGCSDVDSRGRRTWAFENTSSNDLFVKINNSTVWTTIPRAGSGKTADGSNGGNFTFIKLGAGDITYTVYGGGSHSASVPDCGPVEADIYLINSESDSPADVFAVKLHPETGIAELIHLVNIYHPGHIAVSTDNKKLFIAGHGELLQYDLVSRVLSRVGTLDIPNVVQASINVDQELWIVSQSTDRLYHVSTTDASIIKSVKLDFNVTGGDMVFTPDALLVSTGQKELYTVNIATGKGTLLNQMLISNTGMAVLDKGFGPILTSTRSLKHFQVLDQASGANIGEYAAMYQGEPFTFAWGDMATANLSARFNGCQIYLADQDSRKIYTISEDINSQNAGSLSAFDYPQNYRDPHIALNPQATRLYVIDSDQPNKFGYYDIATKQYVPVGALNGVGKITQLAFSPYGELYFSSNSTNALYKFTDIESATYTSLGLIKIDNTNNYLQLEGADIAFDQDGTFYVSTNRTNTQIYSVSGMAQHLLAVPFTNLSGHLTGLAVDIQGNLLVSRYRTNNLVHIDTKTKVKTTLTLSGALGVYGYGDMSSACLDLLEVCGGYASAVISYNPGTLATGQGRPVQERMNPNLALGAPQENDVVNFVSLGFGGDLVVELASPVYNHNKNGVYVGNENSINFGEKSMADLIIVETSYGRRPTNCGPDRNKNYPEKILVYGKQSLNDPEWILLSVPDGECRSSFIDVAPAVAAGLKYVKYLKIVDITESRYFDKLADGYDVDGIIICPEEVVAAITGEGRSSITNARSLFENPFSMEFFNKAPNEVGEIGSSVGIEVYPNPATEFININNAKSETMDIQIYNFNGQLIESFMLDGQSKKVQNVGSWNAGMYVIEISSPNTPKVTRTIIKK